MIDDSKYETNFPYELLFIDREVSGICLAFANNSSAYIKVSKTELPQIVQSTGFFSPLDQFGIKKLKCKWKEQGNLLQKILTKITF